MSQPDKASAAQSQEFQTISRRYRTVVCDPPWAYKEGWPGVSTSPRSAFKAREDMPARLALPYPSMSLEQIAALPVAALAEPDAHLFLWTTNRYLRVAFDIIEGWGFRHSCVLTWCKTPRGIGPGGLFATASEFVLYARRGKPKHTQRQAVTWFTWPRGAHSVKPEAFLDLVENAVPGPYLEMFARRNRLGWDTWGNEALEHVEIAV